MFWTRAKAAREFPPSPPPTYSHENKLACKNQHISEEHRSICAECGGDLKPCVAVTIYGWETVDYDYVGRKFYPRPEACLFMRWSKEKV